MPRLRVFAGPNGSGKSTIKDQIPSGLIGIYVNADEIEKAARADGFLELHPFNVTSTPEELESFLVCHPLLLKAGLEDEARLIGLSAQRIDLSAVRMNSYYASVVADFIRHRLMSQRVSFTFETVMSSEDKVRFMESAQAAGYRTYLYFVATQSSDININRVASRVKEGGHSVPTNKIVERYTRSLRLLPSAIAAANRAFIFDNSYDKSVLLAEITEGTELKFHMDHMPQWFMAAYLDRLTDAQ